MPLHTSNPPKPQSTRAARQSLNSTPPASLGRDLQHELLLPQQRAVEAQNKGAAHLVDGATRKHGPTLCHAKLTAVHGAVRGTSESLADRPLISGMKTTHGDREGWCPLECAAVRRTRSRPSDASRALGTLVGAVARPCVDTAATPHKARWIGVPWIRQIIRLRKKRLWERCIRKDPKAGCLRVAHPTHVARAKPAGTRVKRDDAEWCKRCSSVGHCAPQIAPVLNERGKLASVAKAANIRTRDCVRPYVELTPASVASIV